jgi:hypothetical protein
MTRPQLTYHKKVGNRLGPCKSKAKVIDYVDMLAGAVVSGCEDANKATMSETR